jgi:hypothetical protein
MTGPAFIPAWLHPKQNLETDPEQLECNRGSEFLQLWWMAASGHGLPPPSAARRSAMVWSADLRQDMPDDGVAPKPVVPGVR